jgi:hypothetical protein
MLPEQKLAELANSISEKLHELKLTDGDRLLILAWMLHTEMREMSESFDQIDQMFAVVEDKPLSGEMRSALDSHVATCKKLIEIESRMTN